MNCNCCNCSNQGRRCGEGDGEIKIYGQLVNATLDSTLDNAKCQADNKDYETGHNDALAYAYQIHDGRFRGNDDQLDPNERFQDAINRRVTNIDYDPENNETLIFNKETNKWDVLKGCDCDPYDDTWLKGQNPDSKDGIIGANPDNYTTKKGDLYAKDLYPNGEKDEHDNPIQPTKVNNVIDFILNLSAEIANLRGRIASLEAGQDTCLWMTSGDGICPKNTNAKVYSDNGFFDRDLNNPA